MRWARSARRRSGCRLLAMTVLLGCLWSVGESRGGGTEPASAGIDWQFAPDSPSAAALIGFRAPPRPVKEVQPGFLWIDAADFSDYGGWRLDTQFVHLMGSGYLIAAGVSKPVQPASVEVPIPRKGTYRLWVRSRNWLPEYSPGRFEVAVGGRVAATVFGRAPNDRWMWESGGSFALARGPVKIELRDLTGQYGRASALILTTNADYVPPNELEAFVRERARLMGLDRTPKPAGRYDVVVVGGGAAGCCAAIASARHGARTVLIQDRPVLGGNASLEMGVGICGAAVSHRNAREGGIIEEAGRIRTRYGFHRMSEPFRILAQREKNLSVALNQRVIAAKMRDSKSIAAVKAVDTLTAAVREYCGRMFIDSTGDGWLGYYAGADYRIGRESRKEFGEDLAPEKPDQLTMSGCIMGNLSVSFRSADMGRREPYTPPAWALALPSPEEFGRRIQRVTEGDWWLEHPGAFDDLYEAERARDELIRITFGFWDYLKNKWPQRAKAADYRLVYVPIWDAKRETRRLMGDYLMKQQDVLSGRVFPDRIAHGGWPIDVHHPQGILSGLAGPYDCHPRAPIYTIPFRCLYSRNVENLLFAGRDVSVTHIALGSVRVQGTLSTLGQAAGTAAALCVRHDTTPRGIYQSHLAELQQDLLKDDQYIPELKNQDPADLAQGATVRASSTVLVEKLETSRSPADLGDSHELAMNRAAMFPVGVNPRIDSVKLHLRSTLQKPTPITLHLRAAETFGDFSSNEDLAASTVTLAPGKEAWVSFPIACDVPSPLAWVWLPRTPGVWWRLTAAAPKSSCRAYGGGGGRAWTVLKNQFYTCATEPVRAIPVHCPPENVINGVSRTVSDQLNLWVSDPEKPMPQWIELDLGEPTQFNTVCLTFDTNMNARHKDVTDAFVPQCVRDYELAVPSATSGGWRVLTRQTDNFQRRRVHHFDPVVAAKLRLTIYATNGVRSARVFEMRVYNECDPGGP